MASGGGGGDTPEPGHRHLDEERDGAETRAPLHVHGGAVDTGCADRPVEHLLVWIRVERIDDEAQSVPREARREHEAPDDDRAVARIRPLRVTRSHTLRDGARPSKAEILVHGMDTYDDGATECVHHRRAPRSPIASPLAKRGAHVGHLGRRHVIPAIAPRPRRHEQSLGHQLSERGEDAHTSMCFSPAPEQERSVVLGRHGLEREVVIHSAQVPRHSHDVPGHLAWVKAIDGMPTRHPCRLVALDEDPEPEIVVLAGCQPH